MKLDYQSLDPQQSTPTPNSKISIRVLTTHPSISVLKKFKYRNDPAVNWSCKYGVNITAAPNVGAWGRKVPRNVSNVTPMLIESL
jgi:hypothetical protein